jgi:hypothetical protein
VNILAASLLECLSRSRTANFFEENKQREREKKSFSGTFHVEQLPGYGSQRGARSIIAGTSVAAGGTGFDISTIMLQRSY